MISFALMLMTLPSRMAEVRAGLAVRAGRVDQARQARLRPHGQSEANCRIHRGREGGCSIRGGDRLDKSSSAPRDNASPARTGRYNKER